ncbi:hypothetical protein ACT8ZV_01290 [Nocardioides sp. MAHUQ-72]|uniref:hypothetical protein n=1 Tax=unclassified Nocardioides TaxID=2615069 RepID=UPI00360C8152
MRMNRITTGLISFALVGLAPLAVSTSADAATSGKAAHAATAPSATERQALPKREITSKIVQKGTRKLVFKGKVKGEPKYADKIVKIQRRVGKNGSWKFYAKDRTDNLGYWKHAVGAPRNGRWYFRAMTPKTGQYSRSYSDVWYTYSI